MWSSPGPPKQLMRAVAVGLVPFKASDMMASGLLQQTSASRIKAIVPRGSVCIWC